MVVSGFEGSDSGAKLARGAQLGGLLVGPEDWFGTFKGRTMLSRLRAPERRRRAHPAADRRRPGGRDLPRLLRTCPRRWASARSRPPTTRPRRSSGPPAPAARWRKAGFDLNLAPIADVATLDSPLSDRAFSDDPELVTAMTAASVRGCRERGIACATPYFPGLGAASGSTAAGPATVGLDAASLEVRDLAPFRAAIAEKVPGDRRLARPLRRLRPGHPRRALPRDRGRPAARPARLQGRGDQRRPLRRGARRRGCPPPEAAVQALAAGHRPGRRSATPPRRRRPAKAILEAARSGAIPAARLKEAIARVLSLKQRLGLLP